MKNLFSYKDFVNEKFEQVNEAKKANPVNLFKKDVKNIIEGLFTQSKKMEYEFDKDGFPTEVKFEITKKDFMYLDEVDVLKNEFSKGVLKKREFVPVLNLDEKEEEKEGDKSVYTIKFKIKKEGVEKAKEENKEKNPRSKQFDRDSDKQLKAKLKSDKTNDADKEKIMDILKGRGVDFKNPFLEEDDDKKSDEDAEKEAEKAAKEEEKKDKKKKSIKESVETTDKTGTDDDGDEKEGDEKEDEGDEKTNEGFIGKVAKFLSKKEYNKTLDHCYDNCCEDGECCTLEEIKDCMKGMVFSKVTKKAMDEDSKLFNSLASEIHKDCKKKCDEYKKNESVFGTEEWNKKYNVKTEEEKKDINFNSLVNETVKTKVDDIKSLNEKVDEVLYYKIESLNTVKKINEENEISLTDSLYGFDDIIKEIEKDYNIKNLSKSIYELLTTKSPVVLDLVNNWHRTLILSVDPTLFHFTITYYEEDDEIWNEYLECGYVEDWADYIHTIIKLLQSFFKNSPLHPQAPKMKFIDTRKSS